MRRGSSALFRAVVLLGAELTACSKHEPAVATDRQINGPNSSALDVVNSASETPSPEESSTAAEPSLAPSEPDAVPTASDVTAVPAATASPSAAPRSSSPGKKAPCPPGSEMPFPPCYYIL